MQLAEMFGLLFLVPGIVMIFAFLQIAMLKIWPLCVELNLGDRVFGEVEKKSFIPLPGKGGTQRARALKNCVSQPRGIGEEFYSNGSRAGFLIRVRVCAGPALL